MDVNYDYVPQTLVTSEKQRSNFGKRKIYMFKKNTRSCWVKKGFTSTWWIQLKNNKATNHRGNKTLGCKEKAFTNFVES